MSFYRRISNPADVRFFDDVLFAAHPKRHLWEQFTPPPPVVDPDPPIMKEDLIRRAISQGKLPELISDYAAMTNAEKFLFNNIGTFSKDDPIYIRLKAALNRT